MGWLLLLFVVRYIGIQPEEPVNPEFHPPLDIPMVLSGNFGEIRSGHFHSGIDIKTRGTTGHRIYSIDKGHVSRIKVQANGYGKAIYIAHNSGYTSVYGHLDRYRDDIAAYVERVQYQRRAHVVDIYPDAGKFQIEKGSLIGYSGNSGSSTGPHLHFEIRNSANQHPTNVLRYNLDIRDRIKPRFSSILCYPIGNEGRINGSGETLVLDLVRDKGAYTIPYGSVIRASGKIGISVDVFDLLDGAYNRCGIYSLEMLVDGVPVYRHVMDEFSFAETRYVNARINYKEQQNRGIRAHRLHRLPNDNLRLYRELKDNGILTISEGRDYTIRLIARDVAGNQSEAVFTITGAQNSMPDPEYPADYVKTLEWDEVNRYQTANIRLEIPANALYQNTDFRFSASADPVSRGLLSDIYHVHTPETPLHLHYNLRIRLPDTLPVPGEKLLMVSVGSNGELEAAGGSYGEGFLSTRLREFGSYAVYYDTLAPEISPANWNPGSDLSGKKSLVFNIRDNLSGIEKYEGYIDNRWVLFEYDPKNELLTCHLNADRIQRGTSHELELYVTDATNNVSLFHSTFTW